MAQQDIQAPFPGVFYRRPAPDKPVFVEEGQRVEVGTVIGLIEVMKQFFELRAEMAGTVSAFLIAEETVVEAGQTVATVEASS
ncbi:biotin carboxyl carrier domain-containing protein [Halomonas daqingensis]|uniref:acetyl-CoA carboxylase n=1 Tax=Billgrantia desiderata TaxID=52021 RepID=UPI0017482798|nr:acetyl-CoA carboxylase [Halomonas desiderata]MCE8013962.1 biotin carboxyl carrier domain-containing protein [Halomonas desiderata]MCE8027670.1 biotin carboxyl carrier domain-containing protein [Halomonas desiderata]NIC39146.1 biotin carboxyl carrier domain-containing protein [Halomonas desiderata]